MKFEIVKTNIINVTADAIVLPANSKLKEGPGASSAIFEAAGRKDLTKACNKIGHCEVGSAVPTLAYNLDANYIIHAVVPKWIDGNHNEYELLSSTYLSALNLADAMACASIAFPLLASGNNGYDLELAFHIAEESILSFMGNHLKSVILVIFGERTTALIKNEGYPVIETSASSLTESRKNIHKEKANKFVSEGKEIAFEFLENQIQKGLDYLKDEKHREELIATGISIAKIAYKHVKNKK